MNQVKSMQCFSLLLVFIFVQAHAASKNEGSLGASAAGARRKSDDRKFSYGWYRMTNNYAGVTHPLTVTKEGNTFVMKGLPIRVDERGQLWRLQQAEDSFYYLQNNIDERYVLDVGDANGDYKPRMTTVTGTDGQKWRLSLLSDGTYRIFNVFLGESRYLDVYSNSKELFMGTNAADYTGQHWTIQKMY